MHHDRQGHRVCTSAPMLSIQAMLDWQACIADMASYMAHGNFSANQHRPQRDET